MTAYVANAQKEMRLHKIPCMIFLPSSILAGVYIIAGSLSQAISLESKLFAPIVTSRPFFN